MTTDNFCFYFQNRLIQTSQTGGQWYNDTSPFSIPCTSLFRGSCKLRARNRHLVVDDAALGPSEEALAAFAGDDAVVDPAGLVATDLTRDDLDLG